MLMSLWQYKIDFLQAACYCKISIDVFIYIWTYKNA